MDLGFDKPLDQWDSPRVDLEFDQPLEKPNSPKADLGFDEPMELRPRKRLSWVLSRLTKDGPWVYQTLLKLT